MKDSNWIGYAKSNCEGDLNCCILNGTEGTRWMAKAEKTFTKLINDEDLNKSLGS